MSQTPSAEAVGKGIDFDADKGLMRRFAAVMLKLLLSGVAPSKVHKDLYPGKTPPRSRPPIPKQHEGDKFDPDSKTIEGYYIRFLISHPERAKLKPRKGRLDG